MARNLITTDHLVFGIRHHFSLSMLLVPTRPPSVVHLHPILDLDGEHPISISLAFTHLSATTRGRFITTWTRWVGGLKMFTFRVRNG